MLERIGKGLQRGLDCLIRWLLMGLIRLAFRPKIYYASEKARKEALSRPMLVISNHVRGMDGAVIATLFPGKMIHGMSAKDFMDKKPLGWLLRQLGCFPVDRQHASLDWLRTGRRILTVDKQHVYMCPEGKCNFQKQMQPFKPGAAMLASVAKVPVLPIYHNGEYNYVFGKRFRCMVGEPIVLPEGALNTEELAQETHRMEQEMLKLRDMLAEKS